jgi:hypothetical protein
MSNNPKSRPETGIVELVSGIIDDVHVLVRQQAALLRHEIRGEVGHAREAGSLVAVGLAIVAVGSIFLCGMLVHLLARLAPGLPLWGCYGIVGAPVAALGGYLCLMGIHKFRYFDSPTAEPARDRKE